MPTPSREIRLLTPPAGALRPGDLTVAATSVPDPGPGEVLVRNLVMAVEAVTRLRMAGQLARIGGAGRVVGSTGSAEKARWLREELGFDAAFDHHDGPLADRLAKAAPDGVDVYFDNVGGATLEAAMDAMNPHGRVALCGAVSLLDAADPPGVRNLLAAVAKSITLRGFSAWEFPHRRADWAADQRRWPARGGLRPGPDQGSGPDSAPAPLADP